jgi:hypothetical protein
MSIGVSLAYKAIRVENLNQLPRETLRMAAQIVFGMIGLALALYVLVILILPHLPVLNGALTSLSELGVYSTAHDKNQRAATLVRTQDFSDPELLARQSLLFDPQTSGGLLISVAPDTSQDLVARLKASGFDQAAVIGSITDQAGIAVSAGG